MGRSILPSSVRRDAADLGNLGRPTLESPTQPGSFSAPAADTVKFGWLPDVNAVHASKNPVPVTVQRLQRAVGAVCAIWLFSIASVATALGGPYNFTAGPASPVAARSVLGTLPYTGAVAVGGNTIYYLQGTKVFAVSRGTQPSVVTSVPGPLGAWTGPPKTYGYRDLTFAASPTALALLYTTQRVDVDAETTTGSATLNLFGPSLTSPRTVYRCHENPRTPVYAITDSMLAYDAPACTSADAPDQLHVLELPSGPDVSVPLPESSVVQGLAVTAGHVAAVLLHSTLGPRRSILDHRARPG